MKTVSSYMVRIVVVTVMIISPVSAHHSFSMYDSSITYTFTGVVMNVNPDPGHLQILFVPLNDERDALVRDVNDERVVWSVEMESASMSAREGITPSNFERGTVISVSLMPLRNGNPGGSRMSALFRCPQDSPPVSGMHCDSVAGSTQHGEGELATRAQVWNP